MTKNVPRRESKNKEQEKNHDHASHKKEGDFKIGWMAAKKGVLNPVKHPFFMASVMLIMMGIFMIMMIPGLGSLVGLWMMFVLMISISKSAQAFENKENPWLFCVSQYKQQVKKNMKVSMMALILMLVLLMIMLILVGLLNQLFAIFMVNPDSFQKGMSNTVLIVLNFMCMICFYILCLVGVSACESNAFQGTRVSSYLKSVQFWLTKWRHFIGFTAFWLVMFLGATAFMGLIISPIIERFFPMLMLTMFVLIPTLVAFFTITGLAVGWGYLVMESQKEQTNPYHLKAQEKSLLIKRED